jgi:hypothetical protein
MTAIDVLDSPALSLLLELEAAGLVVMTTTGTIRIGPADRLTAAQVEAIEQHHDALKALISEDGVQARRVAFVATLAAAATALVPSLVYRHDVPYVAGCCFSCGDSNGRPTFGRCWRCSLAWRLALRAPVPADVASAYDEARIA